mgnify:CR=1 FL=1
MREDKRVFVQRLFTTIAPRYDWFNRLASCGLDQRWRKEALILGGIRPGQRILDVCSGTGDLAILVAKRQNGSTAVEPHGHSPWHPTNAHDGGDIPPPRRTGNIHAAPCFVLRSRTWGANGGVVGVDMNREMLTYAQHKQRSQRLEIDWFQADAQKLPFSSESFDCVTIGFSTRNLSDLMQGLREMVRVLRPHGRLIIMETGYPRHPFVRIGYQAFLLTFGRLIGWILTGRVWPFTYLARSVRQFLTPQQVAERLQSLGTQVQYVPLSYGLASLYLATKI